MHLSHINSKSLQSVGYDPASMLLEVKFRISGSIYAFLEVKSDIYQQFLQAKSKGHYFNKYIKCKYRHFKIR